MGVWTDIVLEGFCACDKEDKKKCPKGPDPHMGDPAREEFIPEYWCLAHDCPHFGYGDGLVEVYLWINKFYRRKMRRRPRKRKLARRPCRECGRR